MRRILFIFGGVLIGLTSLSAQDCTELFFSEYLEGSGNNKGLEIYNPTDEVINLGSYWIGRYSNGENTLDGGLTQLEGFIQPYSTHLIVNGQTEDNDISPASDPNLRAMAQQLDGDYPSPTYMNGNDALALFKDNGGLGNESDFELVDLFGIIGGGMPEDAEGWASITDQYIYKNVYDDDGNITGQDSTYVTNYIFPDGYYFLRWWLWSANHSLVRKPNVKHGVTVATMPTVAFNVTLQWDTVPGGQDVWDSLNAHYCYCEHPSGIEAEKVIQSISVYPNPAVDYITVSSSEMLNELEIYDLSGKKVYHENNLYGLKSKNIDVSKLEPGIYTVRANTPNRVRSQKLIKR